MKDKYKLYLKETEYVEEESWKVAKRYSSKAELRMDLGSLPETKGGKARGGVSTPMWALILAFPLLAAGYAICLVGAVAFMLWKTLSTSIIEAWKMVSQGIRLFEQWRYERKEKKDANL